MTIPLLLSPLAAPTILILPASGFSRTVSDIYQFVTAGCFVACLMAVRAGRDSFLGFAYKSVSLMCAVPPINGPNCHLAWG